MHKQPHAARALFGGFLSLALLLSGCSASGDSAAESENTTAEPPADTASDQETGDLSPGSATVSIDGREFSFQLSTCMVYEREVELSGLGGESGSDVPSYLDGGLMELGADALGEVRIDIGSDGPFQSSDEFIALGSPTEVGFSVVTDGDSYQATGKSWDSNGADLGTGTLQFRCV